jgi:hypothetical protein
VPQQKIPAFAGIGAKDGTRTRDPDLGKVVLYQLSYFRFLMSIPFRGCKYTTIFLLTKNH